MRSLVKVFIIEKYRRKIKTKLKSHGLKHEFLMPEAWEKLMGEDRIVQIYFQSRVLKGCQKAIHKMILSDTQKYDTHFLEELFLQL